MGDKLKVRDALPDAHHVLPGVDDACELLAFSLTNRRLAEQVLILGEQDASQGGGAGEDSGVVAACCSILLNGHEVDPAQPQARSDRAVYVFVQIQFDQAEPCKRANSSSRVSGSFSCSRISSAHTRRRSISASSACLCV